MALLTQGPGSFSGKFGEALEAAKKLADELLAKIAAGTPLTPDEIAKYKGVCKAVNEGINAYKAEIEVQIPAPRGAEVDQILADLQTAKTQFQELVDCNSLGYNHSFDNEKTERFGYQKGPFANFTSLACNLSQGKAGAIMVIEVVEMLNKLLKIPLVLIGETPQKPGKDDINNIPDDFKFGDNPNKDIKNDPLFAKSTPELIAILKNMVTYVATDPLQAVVLQMVDRFALGLGSTFTNTDLNAAVKANQAYVHFHENTLTKIQEVAGGLSISKLKEFPKITLNRLHFPVLDGWLPSHELINGLVIAIHQVWAAKIEFKEVKLDYKNYTGTGTLVYTLYDHFGLDWEDVLKFQDYPIAGNGFKAWYILQHYRTAKPFITEIKFEYPLILSF
jgi:Protein of unknown function (DUF3289)